MTAQAQRIAAVLASKDNAAISGWLARLDAALAGELSLDRETIAGRIVVPRSWRKNGRQVGSVSLAVTR